MSWGERSVPIVAVATASGRGAVGIVRVSGKGLMPLAQALCGRELVPRQATYGPFKDAHGEALDHGLALYFPAPHSYTGEDVLELQGHGGPVVMQLLLARCLEAAAEVAPQTGLARLPGLRLAEPGEFTQRAFLNDKIDLAQAEAIADLIDASTEAAARSASRSLGGVFSREIEALRDQLINLRMLVEATLDFPEEEIDFLEKADARGRLDRVAATLDRVLGQARQGALLREGLQVVLAGQPNAGKSSLLNALAGAELAIVTPIAGTTRDKVSETIQIEGVPLHVIDTAGLRAEHEASDEVERIGMARSWEAIGQADAVLFLHDLTRRDEASYTQADTDIATRLPELASGVPVVHVFNKADAVQVADAVSLNALAQPDGPVLTLSARTGEGLQALRHTLLEIAGWQAAPEGVFIARQRHVQALRQARGHLEVAQAHAALNDGALDLLAEELRLAHNALGTITGAFSADDLLGEIFTRFCIGK
ncbi:MAG: tRNA uridine-5-carboxymethylaminomethyl(34) synthesis GTPase MnmE [Burkholderiales bacterium]|jgi:tRNA modification GTPase|nr:MAG: tRNA uridine-5-carboxymethylaminomethyl(34) synthesis GTPase MnmE [Burkholderiales bacterium]